jgi:hypothetical protein
MSFRDIATASDAGEMVVGRAIPRQHDQGVVGLSSIEELRHQHRADAALVHAGRMAESQLELGRRAQSLSLLLKYGITIARVMPTSVAIAWIVARWNLVVAKRGRAAARIVACVSVERCIAMPTTVGQQVLTNVSEPCIVNANKR